MNRTALAPLLLAAVPLLMAAGPRLERVVIDDDFPGGYQVEVADVNGDGRPDLVALGGGTCAWYENPSWKKRIITGPDRTPDIISSATADLDGDGKAEVAIAYDFAMNEPRRGKLLLAAQGKGPDDPWEVGHVADVPSIHRLRWHYQFHFGPNSVRIVPVVPGRNPRVEGEKLVEMNLLVAPLFGAAAKPPIFDQEPARLVTFNFRPYVALKRPAFTGAGIGGKFRPPNAPLPPEPLFGRWETPIPRGDWEAEGAVLHAIDVIPQKPAGPSEVLTASNLGVRQHVMKGSIPGDRFYRPRTLVPGAAGDAPKRGASEVHAGRLRDGRRFLATVEPWHGTDVAVYVADATGPEAKFGPRTVVDTTLVDGHALWVADLDGDGEDEVLAGYRGGKAGVNLYRREGETWAKTVVDSAIAAQDLRGGDLDGDGRPDVVAIGGKTHNVVWYRPIREDRGGEPGPGVR